ncbi:hypothetical protein RZS08_58790, partial [Arthrospira platensis SPKY1]|nr:hypothetical protein [Arthrospira platensis SPKY1]
QLHGTRRRYQAMDIGDFGAQSTRDNLISAAAAFQMDTSKAMAIIDSIQDTVEENWRECMAAQGVDEATMQRYARCFTRLDESSDEWQMPGEPGESGGWGAVPR